MLRVLALGALVVVVLVGEASAQVDGACRKDTDCKGDRICDAGVCRAPDRAGGMSRAAPPPLAGAPATQASKLFAGFAVGTGAAIVSGGETETEDYNVNCCVVRSPLHVRAEGGAFMGPNTAIGVAVRMGFPLGTESPNAKGTAFAGLLRLEWFTALGPRLHLGVGAGLLRYPITVVGGAQFEGSDTVALGPLLAEAGAGYALAIGGGAYLVIDVSAVGALATGDHAMGTHVESGVDVEGEAGLLLRR